MKPQLVHQSFLYVCRFANGSFARNGAFRCIMMHDLFFVQKFSDLLTEIVPVVDEDNGGENAVNVDRTIFIREAEHRADAVDTRSGF